MTRLNPRRLCSRLQKKGESTTSWRRRFFVCALASKTLTYYDKPGGEKRATIDLGACQKIVECRAE